MPKMGFKAVCRWGWLTEYKDSYQLRIGTGYLPLIICQWVASIVM